MSTKLLGVVGIVAVGVFAAAFLLKTPEPVSTSSPTPTPQGYTMAQVAVHNSAAGCWSVVNGKVYDLTSWINQHPGGRSAILAMCGHDGSAAFNGQHGGQSRPANELASFYLAPLL